MTVCGLAWTILNDYACEETGWISVIGYMLSLKGGSDLVLVSRLVVQSSGLNRHCSDSG